jgi:hypothetical protein
MVIERTSVGYFESIPCSRSLVKSIELLPFCHERREAGEMECHSAAP